MFRSRIVRCVGVFVLVACGGVSTPTTTTPASTQEAQEVGAPCDVKDGTDTCDPEQTGLCCCTPGPSTHGFCVDICPNPCD
jgi:hypothetical protein